MGIYKLEEGSRKHILSNFLDMTKYKKYDLYNFTNFPHLREVT